MQNANKNSLSTSENYVNVIRCCMFIDAITETMPLSTAKELRTPDFYNAYQMAQQMLK